jgi:hypothetical protein
LVNDFKQRPSISILSLTPLTPVIWVLGKLSMYHHCAERVIKESNGNNPLLVLIFQRTVDYTAGTNIVLYSHSLASSTLAQGLLLAGSCYTVDCHDCLFWRRS